jgi:hypothetical protein
MSGRYVPERPHASSDLPDLFSPAFGIAFYRFERLAADCYVGRVQSVAVGREMKMLGRHCIGNSKMMAASPIGRAVA